MANQRLQDFIVPLNGYIAVRAKKTKSNSPIIIPESAKEAPSLAEVVAKAGDVNTVSVGETVVVPKYSGSEIAIGEEKFLFIKATDLLGRVKD
jgi:chaperonin GroES